jgi:hypothetical protein
MHLRDHVTAGVEKRTNALQVSIWNPMSNQRIILKWNIYTYVSLCREGLHVPQVSECRSFVPFDSVCCTTLRSGDG